MQALSGFRLHEAHCTDVRPSNALPIASRAAYVEADPSTIYSAGYGLNPTRQAQIVIFYNT